MCGGGFRARSRVPTGPAYDIGRAPVAQWIERSRPKAGVGGSNPSGGATPHTARSSASALSGTNPELLVAPYSMTTYPGS